MEIEPDPTQRAAVHRDGGLRSLAANPAAAQAAFSRALEADPGDSVSRMGLAEALRRLGRFADAEATLRKLLSTAPENAAVWSNLGVVYMSHNRRAEAADALRRALELDPRSHGAYLNLANVLSADGRYIEAETSIRAAIALQPQLAVLHCVLASILRATERGALAEVAYRRALDLAPGFVDATEGLAHVLSEKGETAEASRLLEDLGRRTGALEHWLAAGMLQPVIPASVAEIDQARERAAATLGAALRSALPFKSLQRTPATFRLAYQARESRSLLEGLDEVLAAKAPQLSYAAVEARRPLAGRRARVGFVSQFLTGHTVGRVFKGLLQQLDRSRFELVVAHLPGSRQDPVRREIDAYADVVLELPRELPAQRRDLESTQLDLLFFTDIGMSSASYELARSRLAPVQAVGWGHPDTTGLSSIDHFVSWDLAEPEGAEAHYTERLIRLPRLPAYYEAPAPLPLTNRSDGRLPSSGALYGCLQSLFKLHPDFDWVLAEIVRRDPAGWLIFAEGHHPQWETMLRRRWAAWPEVNARAVFLPRQPLADYQSTVATMDVLLDPPHFGSGNTFYDAMTTGVPVVTWPGAFARGRIVSAAYAQMAAGEDLVVPSLANYAAKAVAVAQAETKTLRAELRAAADAELFADLMAVRAFERYLLGAIEGA